jgi:hypothetical protein
MFLRPPHVTQSSRRSSIRVATGQGSGIAVAGTSGVLGMDIAIPVTLQRALPHTRNIAAPSAALN